MRKITSLTASLAFVLMLLTSVVLYIVPQGRVAYWADWRLWGLTKTDWGNIHINLGLLFLIALFLHIYYNWKPLVSYLKDRGRRLKVFTREFNIALAVTLAVAAGTYLMVPPFSWVMNLNDHFKDEGARTYGEPPYGHAELSSLKTFAGKMNLDLARSLDRLEKAGYPVESGDLTLAEVGRRYQVPPQQIYRVIQGPAEPAVAATLPDAPPPGTGNATLADFCARFGLNMKAIARGLKDKGLSVSEALTFKQIAEKNRIAPTDLYEAVKTIARSEKPSS